MIQVRGVNVYPSAVESIIREEPAVVEFQVDISKERGMWELHIDVEVAPGADSEAISERASPKPSKTGSGSAPRSRPPHHLASPATSSKRGDSVSRRNNVDCEPVA